MNRAEDRIAGVRVTRAIPCCRRVLSAVHTPREESNVHSVRGGNRSRPARAILLALVALGQLSGLALAAGARSFKSGPIQITADGSTVWVVNPDHDSVSRLDTATDVVLEIGLPQAAGPPIRHNPLGVSVMENGTEMWVTCHDSDRIYVLRGSDRALPARL